MSEPMTKEQAEAEAAKRERHKPKNLMKNWTAVHDSVKGWHVALRSDPRQELIEARQVCRNAVMSGDVQGFLDASFAATMVSLQLEIGRS